MLRLWEPTTGKEIAEAERSGRVAEVLREPSAPVCCSWDLGIASERERDDGSALGVPSGGGPGSGFSTNTQTPASALSITSNGSMTAAGAIAPTGCRMTRRYANLAQARVGSRRSMVSAASLNLCLTSVSRMGLTLLESNSEECGSTWRRLRRASRRSANIARNMTKGQRHLSQLHGVIGPLILLTPRATWLSRRERSRRLRLLHHGLLEYP